MGCEGRGFILYFQRTILLKVTIQTFCPVYRIENDRSELCCQRDGHYAIFSHIDWKAAAFLWLIVEQHENRSFCSRVRTNYISYSFENLFFVARVNFKENTDLFSFRQFLLQSLEVLHKHHLIIRVFRRRFMIWLWGVGLTGSHKAGGIEVFRGNWIN